MNFNDKIDKYMNEKGIKDLKKLANLSGIPYTTLRDFYNKKSADNSRLSTIRKLSELMNCSLDYLAFEDNITFDNGEIMEQQSDIVSIPVYGTIKAGIPIESQEDIIDYIDIPKSWTKGNKSFYALKISGDSMFPKYQENDIVVFEHTYDTAMYNGKDVAVMINGTESTFKKLLINENGIVLQPYNAGYDIMMFSKEDVEQLPIKVVGVAREKRTKVNED